MEKILLSWVSTYHDYETEQSGRKSVNYQGPTFHLHKNYYKEGDHTRHVLLSTSPEGAELDIELQKHLYRVYPKRPVQLMGLDITDPTDYLEVKTKLKGVIDELKPEAGDIDVLFTTGTSVMRIVMVLLHLGSDAPTHLIQGKDPRFTGGEGQFSEFHLRKDPALSSLYMLLGEPQDPHEDFYMAEALKPVYALADKVAQVDGITTLILGESGTGKEYLARYIYKNSSRSQKEFVVVNCASLNDELLQSELFGHKKGSFSHALETRIGLFEQAKGGTIFLDEIGDISPKMQQSLLRVIQEKEILRLGENKARKVDVRIIAATHRDLEQAVVQGKFRDDLFYRLSGIELYLPSLSEYKPADLKKFIAYFMATRAKKYLKPSLQLSPEVMQLLCLHPFPGNIRELEKIITHFYVFADKLVEMANLPARWKRQSPKQSWELEHIIAQHIQRVLEVFEGNLTHSCKALGMSYNTLKQKIKKYKLDHPVYHNSLTSNPED